jgi:hypothetical protein
MIFLAYFGDIVIFRLDFYSNITETSKIRIAVQDFDDSCNPGEILQEIEIGIVCDDETDDISLLKQYGSLQLVGFESPAQGQQYAVRGFTLYYTVRNIGRGPASIIYSLAESDLSTEGSVQLSPEDSQVARNDYRLLYIPHTVDLFELDYSHVYQASFQVSAVNPLSGLTCNTSDIFTFPTVDGG